MNNYIVVVFILGVLVGGISTYAWIKSNSYIVSSSELINLGQESFNAGYNFKN